MPTASYFNDAPINSPEDDRFGIDPFAQAIARSVQGIASPIGATIAINGVWGSGKSSAVNLVRHHLSEEVEAGHLSIIEFKCWWFRGEEALTLAFLQELNATLEKNLGAKAKELIPKLGRVLLRAGPAIGPAMNLATGGVWGAIAGASVDVAKNFFPKDESVEDLFQELSSLLETQNKRYLVIIDDIDRLAPDEAVLIFRLIKSVGRLPNILYLLVFDRDLAEGAVNQRYPSEGPHFLEKIIQASFAVPLPAKDQLNHAVLTEIEKHCGAPQDQKQVKRFMNIFYDIVAPNIKSPRDVTRLSNNMAVSWPAVAAEVNLADYVALEAIRLFESKVYYAVRGSKNRVCGLRNMSGHREDQERDLNRLVELASDGNRENIKNAMMRLFPRLENVGRGSEFLAEWEMSRYVCSERHFDIYFRMALGDEALSAGKINEFINGSSDEEFVRRTLIEAAATVRRDGKSNIPLLFDELNVHGLRIPKESFQPLFNAIFHVADEICREQDSDRGFLAANTHLRIHWLIRRLLFDKLTLEERSKILCNACKNAQLGWLVNFFNSAWGDYNPRRGEAPEPAEKCLLTAKGLASTKPHVLKVVKAASKNGKLIEHPELAYILFRWRDFADDGGKSVKAWTRKQLQSDLSVARFAGAFTGETWSQGLGMFGLADHVAVRNTKAAVKGLDTLMDVTAFRNRLKVIQSQGQLVNPDKEVVDTFLNAWSSPASEDTD